MIRSGDVESGSNQNHRGEVCLISVNFIDRDCSNETHLATTIIWSVFERSSMRLTVISRYEVVHGRKLQRK